MALRFALVPLDAITDQFTGREVRGPKYFPYGRRDASLDAPIMPAYLELFLFGAEPVCLIVADLTNAQANTLNSQPNVIVLPAAIGNQVGANLTTVQNELEAIGVPSDGVTATVTYRQILRRLLDIFDGANRVRWALKDSGRQACRIYSNGATLATTLGELPDGKVQALKDAADDAGIDRTGFTLSSTLRDVLIAFGAKQSARTIQGIAV
jgi:hypothetical protein